MPKNAFSRIVGFIDDRIVYLITAAAVFFGPYVGAFQRGGDLEVSVSWPRLVISGLLALSISARDERVGSPEARLARRKNLVSRLERAAFRGFSISVLVQGGK